MQTGSISVQTENIFPIIKKFLYSDHEIFLRELVSNAVDATTKLQVLAQRGEVKGEIGDTYIEIIQNQEEKTITVRDRGVGMTEEEVLKYLNQIAFSSATEFLEKYKDSSVIGHFGLGFYSAFMVADKVEVVTKSWQKGAEAVKWTCSGDPEYTIEKVKKKERGTDIVLHINEENKDFLDKFKLDGLLEKYCKFLPVEIRFGTKTEYFETGEGEDKKEESKEVPNIINETHPLWKKQPTELKDSDYQDFYRQLYPMAPEPMFWIHLNIDYPFNLTGVLYFPKLGNSMEITRNKIHLYSNQVFVTDDVRDIVPEWLLLLHGVIDSPDIPLNVSRSYLQADGNVKKISEYITRKVADKLHDLFKNDRKAFEEKWRDLGVFIKYGMISDKKFEERAMNFTLVENTKGEFTLINEYKDKIKDTQTDKHGKLVVIYTNDPDGHHSQIVAAEKRGYDVLRLDTVLDNHWMQHMEYRSELGFVFVRVDSETVDNLVQKDEDRTSILSEKEQDTVKTLFEEIAKGKPGSSVQLSPMAPEDMPVMVTRPEFMRRMKEMQAMHGMGDMGGMPDSFNIVVNTNHPVIATKLVKMKDKEKQADLSKYLVNMALLQQGMLRGEELTGFLDKTLEKL
ncbi:MAG: molecular chaperone HtpG [Saprospiraceae bacterium]|nr:molecular chaperone HtpG [Saprospiraceae bacterium]MCB9342949.1 molecular chaperone HtpG [Lewinellaceae bacterium]